MPADSCDVLFYPRGSVAPVKAGELRLLPGLRGTVFRYAQAYLTHPAAVPLDPFVLPLRDNEVVSVKGAGHLIPDAMGDAAPDSWGRSVIDRIAPLARASDFDYLLACGSERAGAMDFVADGYAPAGIAQVDQLEEIQSGIDLLCKKMPVTDRLRLLLQAGTSLGGMRPKTVIEKDGALWIAKFNARDEPGDAVSQEYAGMQLAAACGMHVPRVAKYVFTDGRAVLLVHRFDREALGGGYGRIPYVSARTLIRGYRAEMGIGGGDEYSYLELAEARRLTGEEKVLKSDLHELFRRVVFNILIDNTDDHERNHGLLYDGGWRLAPAFDISSQGTALGYQGMIVGAQGSEASLGNALSQCAHFGLAVEDATGVIEQLIRDTQVLGSVYREGGVDRDIVERTQQYRDRTVASFAHGPAAGKKPVSRRRRRSV
jgi:serine/threonine-protein kinase HipA